MNDGLQITIQVFIRVQFRRIGRKIEDLYLFFMFFQPLFNIFAMMNMKVIQNQKNFTPGIFDQPEHKGDQKIGVHSTPVHHKSHFALVGNGGDHADMAFLGNQVDNRFFSFWSKTADKVCTCLNTCLNAPMNLSFLFLCPRSNKWIISRQRFLHYLRILLVGSFYWLLRRESPSFEILPNCLDRYLDPNALFDKILYSLPCPQSKGKLQLVRCLINKGSLYLRFLFSRKGSFLSRPVATFPQANGLATLFDVNLPYFTCSAFTYANCFRQYFVRNSLLAKTNNLFSYLILRPRTMFAILHIFNKYHYGYI